MKTTTTTTAQQLGVSQRALDLCVDADLIDLHIDTFIPVRIWGYDVHKRHGLGLLRGHFFGHLDLPRMDDQGVTGAMWSLTTNPFRTQASRFKVLQKNRARYEAMIAASERMVVASTPDAYDRARAAGKHAVLPAIQGGNALSGAADLDGWLADRWLTRVTLVHLVDSVYGATSSPLSTTRVQRLSERGKEIVQALDRARIFVDLAHIAAPSFWDAVAAHDPTLPLIATHTGVSGVVPHWRNLDDAQVQTIGQSGGVVGVIYAANFMGRKGGPRNCEMVAEHLEHIVKVAGEHVPAIGSDYDGAIVPPKDMRDGHGHVRLVDALLRRGWTEQAVRGVMGGNFLKSWRKLR
jgi:membrane dipeptidase